MQFLLQWLRVGAAWSRGIGAMVQFSRFAFRIEGNQRICICVGVYQVFQHGDI